MVIVKSAREIELMKVAGKVLAELFKHMESVIVPGISTYDVDQEVEKFILSHGCTPTEKGYYDYPASSCVSVNDTILHGIPSKKIILKEGDIVSLDVVTNYKGYNADACRTYTVGTVTNRAQRLVDVTKQAFFEGVKLVKPGVRLGDVSACIQKYVESHGYNVTRDYTGHGIGKDMHEDPSIPNYGKAGTGVVLQKGMTLAIEPMVLEGKASTRVLGDGWTVKSKDGGLTAHYENTIVVTEEGYEIITMLEEEK